MGTDKRERQKANRQQRLEELAKEQQKAKTRRRVLQIGGLVLAVVVVALLLSIFGGGDDDETVTNSTIATSDSAVDSSSTVVTPSTDAPEPTVPGVAITGETPCPEADAPRTISFEQAPPMCIDPEVAYSAIVETNRGEFTIELDAEAAPQTVNNFVVLARYHYFDNTVCHRAVPDFVVQCGDPDATGSGGPGYTFGDELPASLDEYILGAVAMANSGADTNGSQFFVITDETGGQKLPGPDFSLFGRVTDDKSLGVVEQLASYAQPSQVPSNLLQITSVTIVESDPAAGAATTEVPVTEG